VESETEDTRLNGGSESLRGPIAAAALGGLAGALVGAARVLAARQRGEEDEADDSEEQEGPPEPRDEAEPRDDERESDDEPDVEEEPAAEDGAASTPEEDEQPEQKPSDDGASRAGGDLQKIVERATGQLAALTGREAESVLAVERTDDGWRLRLETVELERVPSSTDMLGAYEVELDRDGELRRYARVDRYVRSRSGDGGGS
jgi:hypothetical protein